jgi:hypothetical protein
LCHVAREDLGTGRGDVDPEFGHRDDGGRVDLVGRFGAGGADLDAIPGQVAEQPCGNLGAPGVRHADEQDAGFIGH